MECIRSVFLLLTITFAVILEIKSFPLDTVSDTNNPAVAVTNVRVVDPRASTDDSSARGPVIDADGSRLSDRTIHNQGNSRSANGLTAKIVVKVTRRSGRYWEPWELNRNVCPRSLCYANGEGSKRPRGTGNSIFYNGDIVLDKESLTLIFGNVTASRRRKRATMRSSRVWKDGIVPYIYADDIAPLARKYLKKAMKKIQIQTCIRFRRKKPKDNDYIRYISEPGVQEYRIIFRAYDPKQGQCD